MRKIIPKKYAISLYQSIKGVEKAQIPKLIKSFVELLIRNKDLSKASKIIKFFNEYANEQENVLEVMVTTAEELDESTKTSIINQLKTAMNKKIELRVSTSKKLIGGVVLQYGDTVTDGSVKRRIELMADSLK